MPKPETTASRACAKWSRRSLLDHALGNAVAQSASITLITTATMENVLNVDEDIYIRALKYAEEKREFTLQNMASDLGFTAEQEELFATQIHDKQIFLNKWSNFLGYYRQSPHPVSFSVDDKFRLLEHEALQEARQNSITSTRWAIAAMGVSIVSLLTSARMSFLQLRSDVSLPKAYSEKIEAIRVDQAGASRSLKNIDESVEKIRSAVVEQKAQSAPAAKSPARGERR